ncbi:MAG: CmpX protein, partial [Candidatus Giovannonibacteria bacterium GW2011_GWA2_53_7]
MFNTLREPFMASLQTVVSGVELMIPAIIGALVFIILGWIFGAAAGRVVAHLIGVLKLDDLLAKAGVTEVIAKAGYRLNTGAFIGWLVKAFIVVIFLMAAFDVLGLKEVNVFLHTVLAYIPQVVVAAF